MQKTTTTIFASCGLTFIASPRIPFSPASLVTDLSGEPNTSAANLHFGNLGHLRRWLERAGDCVHHLGRVCEMWSTAASPVVVSPTSQSSLNLQLAHRAPSVSPRHPVCCSVQLCATVCSHVQLCATMCNYMQLCAAMCNYVQLYATVCNCVQLCAAMCSTCHPVCAVSTELCCTF